MSDHDSFMRLFNGCRASVWHYAKSLSKHTEDAEDLMSTATVIALRSFYKFDRELPFENWFKVIMRTAYKDTVRYKNRVMRRGEVTSFEAQLENGTIELEFIDPAPGPDKQVQDWCELNALASLMTDKDKEMMRLYVIEDVSEHHLSAHIGVSYTTIRKRMQKLRDRLREQLSA